MTGAEGFTDEQLRPYGYNLAQFLNDKKMVQQGYATSEPKNAAAQGASVVTHMLAGHGWNTYSTTVETTTKLVNENPDLVQRFVDASTIGWYNYLYNDNTAGNAAIMAANPDLTVEMLALGIIDSGYQNDAGIGAIDLDRVKAIHDLAVKAGILKEGVVDVSKIATDQFVNKKVGMDLLPK